MDLITKFLASQFNGQESTAAQACLLAASFQVSMNGHTPARDGAYVLDTFPIVRFDFTAAVGPLPQAYQGVDYTSTMP